MVFPDADTEDESDHLSVIDDGEEVSADEATAAAAAAAATASTASSSSSLVQVSLTPGVLATPTPKASLPGGVLAAPTPKSSLPWRSGDGILAPPPRPSTSTSTWVPDPARGTGPLGAGVPGAGAARRQRKQRAIAEGRCDPDALKRYHREKRARKDKK